MATKGNYPIPVRSDGAIVSYFQEYLGHKMIPNQEFEMKLTFSNFSRGRSSAIAIFHDEQYRKWPVFLTSLHDIMPLLKNGKLKGIWTGIKRGIKRGTNYGVMLVRKL
jgi:hypothetical protein